MFSLIKSLHLLGACLFIGNVIVSGLWKAMADRVDDLALARFATRLVNLTDVCFTGGGAVLLTLTGHWMAQRHGGVLANDWIVASYLAFGASGFLWAAVLVPIQRCQARLLRDATEVIPAAYRRLARWWAAVGVAATLIGLPPLVWMAARSV